MLHPNKRPEQPDFVNLTDYSTKRPEGCKTFYSFVYFEDESQCMLDRIYAPSRLYANAQVLTRFMDCLAYIKYISIQEVFN